jgi:hypothetical protein
VPNVGLSIITNLLTPVKAIDSLEGRGESQAEYCRILYTFCQKPKNKTALINKVYLKGKIKIRL